MMSLISRHSLADVTTRRASVQSDRRARLCVFSTQHVDRCTGNDKTNIRIKCAGKRGGARPSGDPVDPHCCQQESSVCCSAGLIMSILRIIGGENRRVKHEVGGIVHWSLQRRRYKPPSNAIMTSSCIHADRSFPLCLSASKKRSCLKLVRVGGCATVPHTTATA